MSVYSVESFRSLADATSSSLSCLSDLAECILYGDSRNSAIIDQFFELELLQKIKQTHIPKIIKHPVEAYFVYKFFSLLLTNIKTRQLLLFTMSHPCLHELIQAPCHCDSPEYYVSMLMSAVRALDEETISLFLNENFNYSPIKTTKNLIQEKLSKRRSIFEFGLSKDQVHLKQSSISFPILICLIAFHNHPDSLSAATAKNGILQLLRLSGKAIKSIIKTNAFQHFLDMVVAQAFHRLESLSTAFNEYGIEQEDRVICPYTQIFKIDVLLEDYHQRFQDQLEFLNDLLELGAISQQFLRSFVDCLVRDLIDGRLFLAREFANTIYFPSTIHFRRFFNPILQWSVALEVSIYGLLCLFQRLTCPVVQQQIVLWLFGPFLRAAHLQELTQCQSPLSPKKSLIKQNKYLKIGSHEGDVQWHWQCVAAWLTHYGQDMGIPVNGERYDGMPLVGFGGAGVTAISDAEQKRKNEPSPHRGGLLRLFASNEDEKQKKVTQKSKITFDSLEAQRYPISISLTSLENNPFRQHLMSLTLPNSPPYPTVMYYLFQLFTAVLTNQYIPSSILLYCRLSLKPVQHDFSSMTTIEQLIAKAITVAVHGFSLLAKDTKQFAKPQKIKNKIQKASTIRRSVQKIIRQPQSPQDQDFDQMDEHDQAATTVTDTLEDISHFELTRQMGVSEPYPNTPPLPRMSLSHDKLDIFIQSESSGFSARLSTASILQQERPLFPGDTDPLTTLCCEFIELASKIYGGNPPVHLKQMLTKDVKAQNKPVVKRIQNALGTSVKRSFKFWI